MKIFIFDRNLVSFFSSNERYAFISIADVGSGHPLLIENENCCGVLRLHFDDMDIDLPYDKIPEDIIVKRNLFNIDHAQKIKDFVNKIDPENIAVHCNMGLSRSPAVAAALYEYFGELELAKDIFERFNPNMHVYRTLDFVLNKD